MAELHGKTILLTGSSRGMGAATARIVKAAGGAPILHGRTESDALKAVATELDAPYMWCDASDRMAVLDAVAGVLDRHGPIDGLVNYAGIVRPKPFLEIGEDEWDEALGINLKGPAWFSQAVIPSMLEHGSGSIVNISSIRGVSHIASPRSVPYSASKAAIINMTATLAKEFGPTIRVNCVAPGFIETDMAQTWSPQLWDIAKSALVGRTGQPSEIGEVVAFLLSDAASFVSGETILADGGYGMANK